MTSLFVVEMTDSSSKPMYEPIRNSLLKCPTLKFVLQKQAAPVRKLQTKGGMKKQWNGFGEAESHIFSCSHDGNKIGNNKHVHHQESTPSR